MKNVFNKSISFFKIFNQDQFIRFYNSNAVGLVFLFSAMAQAQYTPEVVQKMKYLSAEQAINFEQIKEPPRTSISQKMTLFEMPVEYECPLFSNSPYSEILTSLDKMQENLNTVFPQCENKATNEKLSFKATQFRQAVFETKKLSEQGQTYKLSLSVDKMVQAAQQIQESLTIVAQAQTQVCYRSNQQFRSVVFSINEAFQSISPVILDLATQNPALASQLGPALKVLAGADSLSKGLSLIEQIAKDSVMFDMTDQSNRVNTLKNTCQYMKLYKRLEYLRLSRLGQIQSVFGNYQQKINEINSGLNKIKAETQFQSTSEMAASSSDPTYIAFAQIKETIQTQLKQVYKYQAEIETALQTYKVPEIAQCRAIESLKANVELYQLFQATKIFKQGYPRLPDLDLALDQVKSYEETLKKALKDKDLKACVNLGSDWLKLTLEALNQVQQLANMYEKELEELNADSSQSLAQKRISSKEKQLQNEQKNMQSLKALISYAAFESSEIEKRAKDMHRYFFRGPFYNEVKAHCNEADSKNCPSAVAGTVKAIYQWSRNDGPIYELFKNNDQHFMNAYNQMIQARAYLASFEYQKTLQEFGGQLPSGKENYQKFQAKARANINSLAHFNLKNLVQGSAQHQSLCLQARQVLDKYLIASTHLVSSQSLCNMIYPALKEQNVAIALKNYCIAQPKGVFSEEKPSRLQELIYRMVGLNDKKAALTYTYAPVYALDFESSPKAMVDQLIQKYDNLKCEQKAGF